MPDAELLYDDGQTFWRLTREGASIHQTQGAVGTAEKPRKGRTHVWPSVLAARFHQLRLSAEKEAKGFVLRSRHEPARPAEAIESALEAAVDEDPHDFERAQVYADWLQTRSEPRGHLMALQIAADGTKGPRAAALDDEASRLVSEHGMLGDFEPDHIKAFLKLRWRAGFVRWAAVSVNGHDRDALVPRARLDDLRAFLVTELLRLPSSRLLRGLWVDREDVTQPKILRGVAKNARPSLRSLAIGSLGAEVSQVGVQQAPLLLPRTLEHLQVEHMPGLASLSMIWNAEAPRLRSLQLRFDGHGGYEDVEALQHAPAFPLRRLALRGLSSEQVKALWDAPILEELRVLDLCGSAVDESDAIWMRFDASQLEQFVIDPGQLPDDGEQLRDVDVPVHLRLPPLRAAPLTRWTPGGPGEVLDMAATTRAALAGQRLATDDASWSGCGCTATHVWGDFEGTSSYRVCVSLDGPSWGCSCPSSQAPCKHELALLLRWLAGTIDAAPEPYWVEDLFPVQWFYPDPDPSG